ncbi:MAG: cytochrome ubiquinol oxidase subunit I [Gemmatimonadales bacterium]|nr:cytochrome ubiquinol oxidase subunit I [Gemmatimonadales bacterium]
MTDLFAARSQMAASLGFHIIFACIGIAMPLLMVVAERRWQVTGDALYLDLAKRWSKGTAIMFAVGAVSGTILSFELGLLWPGFMEFAGPIIGMPFSLEGFAFFVEAIFLGVYLYGWDRIPPRAHLWAGVLVAVSGALSGIFVVIANAWMNAPTGFTMVDGRPTGIDPIAALMTPAAFSQTLHMTLAAYAATAFAVAGVHAFMLLRDGRNLFHRRALELALWVAVPASLAQPLSGHHSAQFVAEHQPAKLAAMEALFTTTAGAPLLIGGLPDEATGTVRYGLEIPKGLSFLAFNDVDATVRGLDAIPRDEWPHVTTVHLSFQLMVACGSAMALVALWALLRAVRRQPLNASPWFLRAVLAMTPLGFVATEAGWMVTEVGRQPWIIHGVLRTAEAVTPMPGLVWPLVFFLALYALLAVAVAFLLWRQIVKSPDVAEWRRHYVPAARPAEAPAG